MADRSLHLITTEINHMLENINTWSVSLKELIKIRRMLLNNPDADKELYDIIDVYSELYYAVGTPDNSKPTRTVTSKKTVNHRAARDVDTRGGTARDVDTVEIEDDDEDVDTFLQNVIKDERKTKNMPHNTTDMPKNMTEMQKAALNVITNAELEAKQMDDIINARRRQMEKDMRNPPKKPVKFTVSDTAVEEPVVENNEEEVVVDEAENTEDEEVLVEIDLDAAEEKEKESLETKLNNVMANINADSNIRKLIDMQKEQPIFNVMSGDANSTPAVNSTPVVNSTPNPAIKPNSTPVVKFNTPEIPEFDPKFGPLYSLTAKQRKDLSFKWFKRAVSIVDEQLATNPASPNTRARLIREETFKQQEDYLSQF